MLIVIRMKSREGWPSVARTERVLPLSLGEVAAKPTEREK